MSELRLLKVREVIAKVGLSRGHLYRMIAAGEFPKPVPLSARARAWRSDEIDHWIDERTAAREGVEG